MTTAPTPARADALIREHRASIHPEVLPAWASDAVDELGRLLAQVHKLEMDVLDLASENSILKRQDSELEARKPLPLSDEQIDAIADGMPGGLGGFMKTWGWRQFARKILDLRAPPTWEPGFDFMVPGQEELAMQFCLEIAGPRGKKGSPPDPVRLMEMAQALYKAEADARPKET